MFLELNSNKNLSLGKLGIKSQIRTTIVTTSDRTMLQFSLCFGSPLIGVPESCLFRVLLQSRWPC
uniref:Uncharacterized protein n=1 Tax=Setaria italica TaxID=4555 RepID=K3Y3U8_SETIT